MQFDRISKYYPQPQPGEIWVVNCDRPHRYAQIVKESLDFDLGASYPVDSTQIVASEIVSIMVLSLETQHLSDVDLLIPSHISGLDLNLLAETWNVEYVSISSLAYPTGKRLSRDIYNILLSVGDRYDNPTLAEIPIQDLHDLGLEINSKSPVNDNFHRQEQAWIKSVAIDLGTLDLMAETMAVEREFIDLDRSRICLSQWTYLSSDHEWQDPKESINAPVIAIRSTLASKSDIKMTISQLNSSQDKSEHRRLITQLGMIGRGNPIATATLTGLLSITKDDENLWTIVDVLQIIDPQTPPLAIGKVKSIDVGERVNLVLRWIQKADRQIGVFMQVYPDRNLTYLPANLRLSLLDDLGLEIEQLMANADDYCIQLKFGGEPGELFSIALELDGVSAIENFVL